MYLNCHSYFSLRYGTIPVQNLVNKAVELGIDCLALTDINNTSGVFDFVKTCNAANIRPIVGVEFRNSDELKYICLAKNNEGFREINYFLTEYLSKKKDFPNKAPSYQNAFTIYPLDFLETSPVLENQEFIGVHFWEIPKTYRFQNKQGFEKIIAIHTITFFNKIYFNLHRLLRAIDHNTLLSKLPKYAEANPSEWPIEEQKLFENFQYFEEWIEKTKAISEQCSFNFNFKTSKNKRLFTNSKTDDIELLRKLTADGMIYRYGKNNKAAQERIDKELTIIYELDFCSYFLITWDIIRYARSRGYFHVGRGSGANSIVAYCIGITDVNPIELDLYFERFINPFRTSPPDFDIDFSWDERDEIIDYVFKRYGKEYVCLLATYNTFQDRSAVRELAKVFGLPKSEIDEMIKYPEKASQNEYTKYIFQYAPLLEDYPNSLSIHAGGIMISEEPLSNYTALQPMPKGFPICQFDMYVAEDIGFAKFDVLSQRGLGHIKTAVDIVKENRGVDIDIHAIQKFKDDENIRRQLQNHETMGCFYVESPAMRSLIWKLRCDNYITLVAASSIIRPGVSSSGMMKEYIVRYHNPHQVSYLHPKMQELLSDTFGVMVYQEDVLKVAHGFANLTLAEADILRRAMSGKFRSRIEFQRITDKWFNNCKELGYSEELAKEVWRQIESFSGYSFSKAHSASFAVESYQSLYLKTYFPLEFMVAVINNFGGFYSTEFYIHEARRYGAIIEAPEINESEYLTRIEGNVIWLGWIHIKSLESKLVESFLQERSFGYFTSFSNFVSRISIGLEQLIILIRIGAFRNFGTPKKELLWEAHFRYNSRFQPSHYKQTLFGGGEPETHHLPALVYHPLEDAYDQIELLGFSISSPFELVATKNEASTTAQNLISLVGRNIRILGYLVTWKPVRTKNHKLMGFGYFLDERGEFFDTTHFPPSLEKFPFRGRGVYCLNGKVVEEFGLPSLEVYSMQKLEVRADPRSLELISQDLIIS
jgi:DNA-directed DNA polymerase III PolC